MTVQDLQERLLSWATAPERTAELLAAREAHFAARGAPHEDDRSYEGRMAAMLEAWLYDHRDAAGRGIVSRFLEAEAPRLLPAEVAAYEGLRGGLHSLFEVRKLRDGLVRVRDLATGTDHDVTERRTVAGLDKGDVLEARLLPLDGARWFSGAFLYHPREARKAILGEVKRLRKAAGKGGAIDVEALLARLSRMAFKLERYRNVRLESIYDFAADARAATPPPRP